MSWTDTDLVEIRPARRGLGAFARVPIPRGRIVGAFQGPVARFPKGANGIEFGDTDLHMLLELYEDERQLIALTLPDLHEPVNRINHSCEPNCVLAGIHGLTMVAERDIAADEELTFDYRPITLYPIGVPCWCETPRCVL